MEDHHEQISRRHGRLWVPIILFSSIIFSVLALKAAPGPFVWIGLIWMVAFILLIPFTGSSSWLPPGLLLFAALALSLSLSEIILGAYHSAVLPPEYSSPYMVRDEHMLVPVPGTVTRSTRMYKNEILFDTTYTIDDLGMRVSPAFPEAKSLPGVVFFGCSFTYGEGVSDMDALPYQVGKKTDGKFRTFNLAFHGYGSNHMLYMLQRGRAREAAREAAVTHVIYGAIPDHVRRVSGRHWWARFAPRYVLQDGEEPVFFGRFSDHEDPSKPAAARALAQLQKSALFRLLASVAYMTKAQDDALFVAIVAKSQRLVQEQFPEADFHVLLWPERGGQLSREWEIRLLARLQNEGIRVHQVRNILPGYDEDDNQYFIPYDFHPNATAHAHLAQYIVDEIILPVSAD